MRKLLVALVLGLFFASQSYATEPHVPKPIPKELFHKVILDPVFPTPVPAITKRKAPVPDPIVVIKPKKESAQKITAANHSLSGVASWYCKTGISRCTIGHPSGYYAAIRKDLLELRGQRVLVCSQTNCVRVTIIDCNCGANANLIDLYWDAFAAISNPSLGRVKVTIKW